MQDSLKRVGRFDPERARERLRKSFYPEYTKFVVLDAQRIGFYTFRPAADFFHLDHLYVHPSYQSRGIGSHVLRHLLSQSDARQTPVRLGALRDSPSNRFYQRHGFVQTTEDEWDIYYIRAPELNESRNAYLAHSEIIDWRTPSVISHAKALANGSSDDELVAQRCFTWVRDHVRHSRDHRIPVVTLSASAVLQHRAGYCYAKAHLLAALLRASGIPAALCYQRLQLSETDPRFTLHGLNAVFLRRHGWYRLDARGNKPGVNAQFCPPEERLAFHATVPGERDLPGFFIEPLPAIVSVLSRCATEDEVYHALPDIDEIP
jgi:transglutaminase-like putative cysteine protease